MVHRLEEQCFLILIGCRKRVVRNKVDGCISETYGTDYGWSLNADSMALTLDRISIQKTESPREAKETTKSK